MFRYKRLGYVAFNVTDIEKSSRFYRDMIGLEQVGEIKDGVAFFSCSSDYYDIILYQSDTPGLKRIAFQLESAAQLEPAFQVLTDAGLQPMYVSDEERAVLKTDRSIRFRDPNGIPIEFYGNKLQRPTPYVPRHTNIVGLEHVVFKIPKLDEETIKFYTDVLQMRVSDYRIGPEGQTIFAFLRCYPNPDHHSFAVTIGEKLKFVHLAFKVASIDDIGSSRNRFISYNVPVVSGPGRHLAAGCIFLYFLDPDGITLEYALGSEQFPETNHRDARLLDHSRKTTDLWEGVPDPRFGLVGDVE